MSRDPIPTRQTAEDLHDRYTALQRAFELAPTRGKEAAVAEAYARFYRAHNRSSAGLDAALHQLRRRNLSMIEETAA